MSNLVQTRCVRNVAKSSVAAHALSSSTIPIRSQDVGDDDNDSDKDDNNTYILVTTTATKLQQDNNR